MPAYVRRELLTAAQRAELLALPTDRMEIRARHSLPPPILIWSIVTAPRPIGLGLRSSSRCCATIDRLIYRVLARWLVETRQLGPRPKRVSRARATRWVATSADPDAFDSGTRAACCRPPSSSHGRGRNKRGRNQVSNYETVEPEWINVKWTNAPQVIANRGRLYIMQSLELFILESKSARRRLLQVFELPDALQTSPETQLNWLRLQRDALSFYNKLSVVRRAAW